MTVTRGDLRTKILRYLNKTANYSGFYDTDKVSDAIEEALDFVAVNMFMAGEGWLTTIGYITTAAGDTSANFPTNAVLIREVRYKFGDVYVPLTYDDQSDSYSYVDSGVEQQPAVRMRFVGTTFVFDPPLAEGGTDYLQVEYVKYPTSMTSDLDVIDPQFDRACLNFVKYKACSILAGSVEKEYRPWAQEEQEWFQAMQHIVNRRNFRSTRIKEFMG